MNDSPNDYCLGFVFASDCVALIHKARPEWMKGKYNGIGGKLKSAFHPPFGWEVEASGLAMAREWEEETGTTPPEFEYYASLSFKASGAYVYCFRASLPIKTHLRGADGEPVRWFNVHEVLSQQRDYPPLVPDTRMLLSIATLLPRGSFVDIRQ